MSNNKIRFKKLQMKNWMSFDGHHMIEFPSNNGVILIRGENGKGKTAIFNAIRWAWYGKIQSNTSNRSIPIYKFINDNQKNSMNYEMYVSIEFDLEGKAYSLTRSVTLREKKQLTTDFHPTDKEFDIDLFLSIDNAQQSIGKQQTLNQLFPQEISQFFFFDGEELKNYEELINNDTQMSIMIKNSIEKILGIPAFQNTINDLNEYKTNIQKKFSSLQSQNNQNEQTKIQYDHYLQLHEVLKNEHEELIDAFQDTEEKLSDAKERQQKVAAKTNDWHTLQAKRTIRKDIDKKIISIHESEKSYMSNAWQDLIHPTLQDIIDDMQKNKDTYTEYSHNRSLLNTEKSTIEKSLQTNNCSHCNQPLNDNKSIEFKKRIQEINVELSTIPELDINNLYETNENIQVLKNLKPPLNNKIYVAEKLSLKEQIQEKIEIDQDINILEDNLSSHDQNEIANASQEVGQLTQQLNAMRPQIDSTKNKLDEYQKEIDKILNTFIDESPESEVVELKNTIHQCESLIAIFNDSIEILRKDLVLAIENDASDIFLLLANDNTYQGLQINEQYGLTMINQDKTEVNIRSAGYEQIVALSLIFALNKNAVRSGPIIMDTPFGRLDNHHRKEILKYISNLEQSIVFVHSGELNIESDIVNIIDKKISMHVSLEKENSTATSKMQITK